jgi:hypothetical protein
MKTAKIILSILSLTLFTSVNTADTTWNSRNNISSVSISEVIGHESGRWSEVYTINWSMNELSEAGVYYFPLMDKTLSLINQECEGKNNVRSVTFLLRVMKLMAKSSISEDNGPLWDTYGWTAKHKQNIISKCESGILKLQEVQQQ